MWICSFRLVFKKIHFNFITCSLQPLEQRQENRVLISDNLKR